MKLCLDTKIERHDAVGLVHRAWLKSFAKVDSNKRAIADRGWNPLNYKLLDHEELHRVKDDTAVKKAYELSAISFVPIPDPSNLNFSTGIARMIMDKIVEHKVREKALDTAWKDQEAEFIQRQQEIFNNSSKMTAGVAFNSGHVCLNRAVHERVREQYNTRQQKILEAEQKKKDDLAKMQSKVDAIREKSTDPTKWTATELQTMASWFKRPGDSKLPLCKEQLLHRYLLTCNRSEQERSRLKEGEEPVVDDPPANTTAANDNDEGRVAEALLQIGVKV
jgi:hypothetical protein